MARRYSAWIEERAALLVSILAEVHGLHITADTACQTVSDRVDELIELMGIQRRAAQKHLDDEAIAIIAERIAAEVRRQQADRPDGSRTAD